VKLDEMFSLAMIKTNSSTGPIKKMIHVKLFKIFCVKEVPIYSWETRNMLKSLISEWEQAMNGDSNPYLVNIVGTHWNTPEGCVSIVFENMNGGSLLNLL
jgi:hypothetical protein